VFQTFNLLSSLSAQENVELPMILAGELSREEREERAVGTSQKTCGYSWLIFELQRRVPVLIFFQLS
jgi:ABC-type lipoprotein export system ATPase subunit